MLNQSERISPKEYHDIVTKNDPHILIDVREPQELEICSLADTSRNVPYSKMNSEKVMEGLHQYFVEKTSGGTAKEKLPGEAIISTSYNQNTTSELNSEIICNQLKSLI